jgi:hypothetical protein
MNAFSVMMLEERFMLAPRSLGAGAAVLLPGATLRRVFLCGWLNQRIFVA